MKKGKMRLTLNKKNISNLNSIKGGDDTRIGTCTCQVIDDPTAPSGGDCQGTQETTCWSGLPRCNADATGYCLTHEPTCVCFLSDGLPCGS